MYDDFRWDITQYKFIEQTFCTVLIIISNSFTGAPNEAPTLKTAKRACVHTEHFYLFAGYLSKGVIGEVLSVQHVTVPVES